MIVLLLFIIVIILLAPAMAALLRVFLLIAALGVAYNLVWDHYLLVASVIGAIAIMEYKHRKAQPHAQ